MNRITSTLIAVASMAIVMISTANAANRFSIANSNWTAGTTWSSTAGGATCNCTPTKTDNIYINTNVTLDKNLTGGGQGLMGSLQINSGASLNGGTTYSIDIRSGAVFNVYGSLTVNNLTYSSGSIVTISTTGTVTVNGTFTNNPSSNNVTINGVKTVGGTFSNGSSAVISGTGTINITNGAATNGLSGTIFGVATASPCASFPCVLGANPLPIELLAFGAVRLANVVNIKWATATETNNDYFTIERTTDPTMGYDFVATVHGAGNSTKVLDYAYTDASPLLTDCYYRLSQTDFDGSTKTFDPFFVEGYDFAKMKVYPNPSPDSKIRIGLSKSDLKTAVIKIYDMNGTEVKTKLQTEDNGSVMTVNIDSEAIKINRMFYITVISGDKVQREKLVISN